jgi:hypothetical protein
MKRYFVKLILILILMVMGLLLVSSFAEARPLAPTTAPATPEIVIKQYYTALMQSDYFKATEYVAINYLLVSNLTREDAAKLLKETLSDKSVKITHYEIRELKPIDETHQYVSVLYKNVAPDRSASTGVDEMMVVWEDGYWRLDWAMVTKSTPILGEKLFLIHGGEVKMSHVIAHKTFEGLMVSAIFTNKTNLHLRFPWPNHGKFEAQTEKGSWRGTSNKFLRLGPGQSEVCTFVFRGADGIPQRLNLEDIQFSDEKGLLKSPASVLAFSL